MCNVCDATSVHLNSVKGENVGIAVCRFLTRSGLNLRPAMVIVFLKERSAMPEIRYITWEENEAEHAADRKEAAEAIASGRKTAWQVQIENSFIPVDARIEVNFESFLERRAKRNG